MRAPRGIIGLAGLVGISLLASGQGSFAATVDVPSGQPLTLYDVRLEGEGAIARFLFLAPQIGEGEDRFAYDEVLGDFTHICERIALPALAEQGWSPEQVVIAMADREVEFGVVTPEATQFFESFAIADGACEWMEF